MSCIDFSSRSKVLQGAGMKSFVNFKINGCWSFLKCVLSQILNREKMILWKSLNCRDFILSGRQLPDNIVGQIYHYPPCLKYCSGMKYFLKKSCNCIEIRIEFTWVRIQISHFDQAGPLLNILRTLVLVYRYIICPGCFVITWSYFAHVVLHACLKCTCLKLPVVRVSALVLMEWSLTRVRQNWYRMSEESQPDFNK